MDVDILRAQFEETVNTMLEENYMDDYFKLLYLEQGKAESQDVVPHWVKSFFDDAEKHMDEIDAALKQAPVDYKKIKLSTVKIMRKTAWIGAARIHRTACVALIDAVTAQDEEECSGNLQKLRTEVSLLRNHLDKLLKLQEEIVALGGKVPVGWCR